MNVYEFIGVVLASVWVACLLPFSFAYWWQRGRDAAYARDEMLRRR